MPMSRLLAALLVSLALGGCGVGGVASDLASAATSGSNDSQVPLAGGGSGREMSTSERDYAQEVLRLVNVERARVGQPPLAWDEPLAGVAYGHSVDMDQRDFFDHVNPSGQGPSARVSAAGITGVQGLGENIAWGQRTPAEVMASWMGSQGHRENILRASFTHLGIGVHAPGPIWWTQLFGTR